MADSTAADSTAADSTAADSTAADILVAAVYRFVPLPDAGDLRSRLEADCRRHGVVGTLLLAEEGLNGTVAGPPAGVRAVLDGLRCDERFRDLEVKESRAAEPPFRRLKVRTKPEIVTLGVPVDPRREVGVYVDPEAWNDLLRDPDVLVVDTRNEYEVAIGTFEGAEDPRLDSFRDFPAWAEKRLGDDAERPSKIAMFCTGGIRCEKSTSYLRARGFDQVYHLRGGILRYLETVPEDESLWRGQCFVFDERVSVGHGLVPGPYRLCDGCGRPVDQGPCVCGEP